MNRHSLIPSQPADGASPPPVLSVSTFGSLRFLWNGKPVDRLGNGKQAALLAYLAIEPGPHRRETLADLFWPDAPEQAARLNLRQALFQLRRVLLAATGQAFIAASRHHVGLTEESSLVVSAIDFATPLPACTEREAERCTACLAHLAALADVYQRPFLAELSLPDCPGFEDWLLSKRNALRGHALDLLVRLADCHEQRGEYRAALPFALRYVELEPWSEVGELRVMRLYVQDGQPDAALAHFETCRQALVRELEVSPGIELQRYAEGIRGAGVIPAPVPWPSVSEERRQVSVIFCELRAAGVIDPEEELAVLRTPQARCAEIVRQHEGYVVQGYGGGLRAYFGFPQALENTALCAVRAARALVAESGERLSIRVGVHSGLIVTSPDAQVPDAVGTTSGIAIRLRELATVGEVVVSAETQRRVAGYFHFAAIDRRRLRGLSQIPAAFKVTGESGARHRFAATERLAPMIGRDLELSVLGACWQAVCRGASQSVLLRGEAGIGKSRLLLALKEGVREGVVREFRCFPEYCHSPFHPLAALHEDAPAAASSRSREQILADMLDRFYALADGRPMLLLFEDLHWADPSTLEFLVLLVAQVRATPLLAVFTARPEFHPAWDENRVLTLPIDSLNAAAMSELITAVAPGIAADATRRIAARADGVPLFAEEMARDITTGSSSIPATLYDLLAARLDRLGTSKHTAQLAAAIGREFDPELLQKVSTLTPSALAHALDVLQNAGLIMLAGASMRQFKHALIQEAAYQLLTRADRQNAHRRIAEVLESDFPAVVATHPELLARHLTAGGETRPAIDCWIKAGHLAVKGSASAEAIEHFYAGLELLATLPADQDRARVEYKILVSLSPVMQAAKGHGSLESTQVNARLSALSSQVGDCPEAFLARWALEFNFLSSIGYWERPQAVVQLLQMAQDDPVRQMAAHAFGAVSCFWLGKFKFMQAHAERMLALDPPNQRQQIWEQFGVDLSAFGTAYLAYSHYFLGFPEQAQRVCERMLAQARALDHPHTLAQAMAFALLLYRWMNKPVQAQALSAEVIALSRQHGFSLWLATGEMAHGWALVMQGQPEGIAEIKVGDAGMKAAMPEMSVLTLAPLAEAYIHLKQFDAALTVLAQVQADEARNGGVFYTAELHRLKGEALLGLDKANAAPAEAAFRKALAISRKQQAKALELRAATSLARLWLQQGEGTKARRLLAPVFGGFTEGFDTPDLQDAGALLDAMQIRH